MPASLQEKVMHKLLWGLITYHLMSASRLDFVKQKKRTYQIVEFAVPVEHHWIKLKEIKKKDKNFQLPWELKELCNMKVMVILIVIDALDKVRKGLILGREDLEIRGQVKTI